MRCDVLLQRPLPLHFPSFLFHSHQINSLYISSLHSSSLSTRCCAPRFRSLFPQRAGILDSSFLRSRAEQTPNNHVFNSPSSVSDPAHARLLSHIIINCSISPIVAISPYRDTPHAGPFSATLVPNFGHWTLLIGKDNPISISLLLP
jgi:hypothetical protein